MKPVNDIKAIKDRISIVTLAEDLGLDLTNTAKGALAFCPVCHDVSIGKHRHLSLNSNLNCFHCIKCKVKGDHVDLIRLVNKCSTKQAIDELKRFSGYSVSTWKGNAVRAALSKPKPESITRQDFSGIYELLITENPISQKAFEYLHIKRGLDEKTIKNYRITSIDNPEATFKKLKFHHTEEVLQAAGLITISAAGKPYFTFWKPCILFPHLENGKPVYISNRNLQGEPKAFKLAGSNLFRHYTGSGVNDSLQVLIFEGIFNALSYEELTQQSNFIAMLGTISPDQYQRLLIEYPGKELILALDPDFAGMQATERISGAKYVNWEKIFIQFADFQAVPVHENGKQWDLNDLLVYYKEWFYTISGRFVNDGMSFEQADHEATNLIFKGGENEKTNMGKKKTSL